MRDRLLAPIILSAAFVSAGVLCGPAGMMFEDEGAQLDEVDMVADFRVAKGSRLSVRVSWFDVDVATTVTVATARSLHPSIAVVDGHDSVRVNLQALDAGTTSVVVETTGAQVGELPLEVVPVYRTEVRPVPWLLDLGWGVRRPFGETLESGLALLPGAELLVHARHLDREGDLLKGYGLVTWSVEGDLELDDAPTEEWRAEIARIRAGTSPGTYAIATIPGGRHEVAVTSEEAVVRLAIKEARGYFSRREPLIGAGEVLRIRTWSGRAHRYHLYAFDADDRYVAGEGEAAPIIESSSVVTAIPTSACGDPELLLAGARTFCLRFDAAGTADLRITWAGQTLDLPIEVELHD